VNEADFSPDAKICLEKFGAAPANMCLGASPFTVGSDSFSTMHREVPESSLRPSLPISPANTLLYTIQPCGPGVGDPDCSVPTDYGALI